MTTVARGAAHGSGGVDADWYLGRFPPATPELGERPATIGRFVNTVRGSGFPEIILDDLADEFFRSRYEEAEAETEEERQTAGRERPGRRRVSGVGSGAAERRRGRSVSRCRESRAVEKKGILENCGGSKGISGGRVRRRSASVCRCRSSDSENDLDFSHHTINRSKSRNLSNGNVQRSSFCRPTASSLMRKSASQKDLLQSCDNYLMEHPIGDGEASGLYEVMRKEVQHAVEEIRTELEKSEKHRQELLAGLAVEEQQGHELTDIVKGLLPAPKQTSAPERSSRSRKRSKDINRMSKHLTEEGEKYLGDFLSSVEDNDISSFDGERSDKSLTIGGSTKFKDSLANTMPETLDNLTRAVSLPTETDGVVLPWLQWETNIDPSPSPCKSKVRQVAISNDSICSDVQEIDAVIISERSWNPECSDCCSTACRYTKDRILEDVGSLRSCSVGKAKTTSFDLDEYKHLQPSDDLLLEIWRQRQRIESGSLLLCERTCI